MQKLGKLRPFSLFGWIGHALLLLSLVTTVVVVSPAIAPHLGLGTGGRIAAFGIAVMFDLLWVGALHGLVHAVQVRRRPLAVVLAVAAFVATATSATALHLYGDAWLLSGPPVAAMAALALDAWMSVALPDADTRASVRDIEADSRNRLALMEAHVRRLREEHEWGALEETASTLALASQGRARALSLMSAQVIRMETTAAVREGLTKASKRTGVDVPRELPEAAPAASSRTLVPGVPNGDEAVAAAAAAAPQTALEAPVKAAPQFAPKHSDEELMKAARILFLAMEPPRSGARFEAAMKDAGYGAKATKLREIYRAVLAEFENATVDAITADTEFATENDAE